MIGYTTVCVLLLMTYISFDLQLKQWMAFDKCCSLKLSCPSLIWRAYTTRLLKWFLRWHGLWRNLSFIKVKYDVIIIALRPRARHSTGLVSLSSLLASYWLWQAAVLRCVVVCACYSQPRRMFILAWALLHGCVLLSCFTCPVGVWFYMGVPFELAPTGILPREQDRTAARCRNDNWAKAGWRFSFAVPPFPFRPWWLSLSRSMPLLAHID